MNDDLSREEVEGIKKCCKTLGQLVDQVLRSMTRKGEANTLEAVVGLGYETAKEWFAVELPKELTEYKGFKGLKERTNVKVLEGTCPQPVGIYCFT